MGSRGKKKNDLNLLKCATCCHVNSINKGTLPAICPLFDKPCSAIDHIWLTEEYRFSFVLSFRKHECNREINDYKQYRIPIDDKHIDLAFIECMENTFKKYKDKGIETDISEAY